MTALGKLFRTTAFKISLAYLVISSIGAALVLFSVGWNLQGAIDQQIEAQVDADMISLLEEYQDGGITRLVEIIDQRVKQPGAGLYLVTTFAGQPLVGNVASLPVGALDHASVVETTYKVKGSRRRAFVRVLPIAGSFRLLVGHDLEEGESLRPILWQALFTSLAWLAGICTIGGLVLARRVLRRVDAISVNARKIADGDLAERLPLAGTDDELDRLVGNLNAMLARIAELMAGVKEVSDNVAHDLKTPLTRLRARAEQTLQLGRHEQDYRDALGKVIEEADGMIRIFDALLMIARAEAGAGRDGMTDFDAAAVASDVGELYEPLAEDHGVRLEGEIDMDLTVHGSRELIGQALSNLIDNALKYGIDEAKVKEGSQTIRLTARRRGAMVEIAVSDNGAGVAPQDRHRITDRFVRLENSRSRAGSGLGLSLVAAVARLHNGVLRIEDNEPGARFVIALPAVRGVAGSSLPAPVQGRQEERHVEPSPA